MSGEPSASSRWPLPASLWAKVFGSFALAGLGVLVLPGLASGGSQPPVGTLLAIGILVGGVTAGGLYMGIRRDLKLPARVAILFVAYNALIVLVKFVLAPAGLYQANRRRELTSLFGGTGIVLGAAALVLVLYVVAFTLLFFVARKRLVAQGALSEGDRRIARGLSFGGLAILSIAGVAGVAGLTLLTGGGSQYLDFIFSSGFSLLIALALALACAFVVMGFQSMQDRSRTVVDVTALLNLFWLGLAFIVLFHVLWVVYVLVLTSIWPLKVVVPK